MKNALLGLHPHNFLFLPLLFSLSAQAEAKETRSLSKEITLPAEQSVRKVNGIHKLNPTTVEILINEDERITLDFYGDNIFRMFQDNNGGILRAPDANPPAEILVKNPRRAVSEISITETPEEFHIQTPRILFSLNRQTGLFLVTDKGAPAPKVVIREAEPIRFSARQVELILQEDPQEYFYGGGVQNGRFSHKGKSIAIENQNSWTDGGVASPTPFYWSTNGYGIMGYTFRKGKYDFGSRESGKVILSHETPYLDLFIMVNETPVQLLNDFYQLTGNPVLMPKFGFYQGHLNAYNRDYWKEDPKGILFEDGKRYAESQKDNGGIKESLNGEKGNYQFSARAVIDRYRTHDMPLGWLLPNDGYGAGYGQTETLVDNIDNLAELTAYARQNGVEIGLWTQSDLHPKPEVEALLQRDIVREVRDAGVRVLKTDVAWVGAGYSFGLNGIADVADIMTYYGNDSRPFIISLDGWAGTQRYAGVWTGDQTGGVWEYIRFHIPTYIGSGLSGQPNISSDMDGIFGGKNSIVNTRDFQWKTFTPMELNMDGWGANEKYPHALGEPATSINRWYLKMKSELIPYTYTIAQEAVSGKPMVRAMFLEDPNAFTYGRSTRYQFLYGPSFLVAPIYEKVRSDEEGNDIRNGIYLPEGNWIDYFSGERYRGGRILNNIEVPLWKLPVFVKAGSIIPVANPNNNVSEINKELRIYEFYPEGHSSFTEYDDDGVSEAYRKGAAVTTEIESQVTPSQDLQIILHPANGGFAGFIPEKQTELRVHMTGSPKKINARIGNKKIRLTEAASRAQFEAGTNAYFYDKTPELNRFATPGSEFAKVRITGTPVLYIKLEPTDVTMNKTTVEIDGFQYDPVDRLLTRTGEIVAPTEAGVTEENKEAYTLRPTWYAVDNADYYEIMLNDMLYSTIRDTALLFEDLEAETNYEFRIRSVNQTGASDWNRFHATTKSDPLQFAIRGAAATTTVENQGGAGVNNLFDFDEGNTWHTKWGMKAVPFDMIIDLNSFNNLDKFHYLPRSGGGNGILLKGSVAYSMDKENWTEAGDFEWDRNDEVKVFRFNEEPKARYIRLSITDGVGGFGSGRELYVFRVAGSESYLPGDINNDRLIDRNDLTSYMNYTGLRQGDADFEGYISNGDVNRNGLIDAYDISVLTTRLDGGVQPTDGKVAGKLQLSTTQKHYKSGDILEIQITGKELQELNAFSFALPYDARTYEFIGVEKKNAGEMENLTYDRLHTNGTKALYPTFVNIGEKPALQGNEVIAVLKFKVRKDTVYNLKAQDYMLVDKMLNTVRF